jgi:hypothetical protein
MSPIDDPALKALIPELGDILKRAYSAGFEAGRAQGERDAVTRIIAAVQPGGEHRQAPERVPEGIAPRESQRRTRLHPYGFVKNAVSDALTSRPGGITRMEIRGQIQASKSADIDDATIKNTLKAMMKNREAHSRDGTYFPGPAPGAGEPGRANAPA